MKPHLLTLNTFLATYMALFSIYHLTTYPSKLSHQDQYAYSRKGREKGKVLGEEDGKQVRYLLASS